MKNILAALVCCLIMPGLANADFYRYTFTGVVPDGISTHPEVADGETWTASFIIDSTIVDDNPDPQRGVYFNAVLSGTLEFSGGFVPIIDFAGARALVLDDVFSADSISIRGEFNSSNFAFQANSQILSTLSNDLLVGPGFSFDSFPSPSTIEYNVFTFADDEGAIVYFGDVANNSSFSATAIPEAGSGVLVLALAMAGTVRRQRG